MRKILISSISVFCFLFFTACATVVSKYPVGLEDYAVPVESWEGTWWSDDEFIKIKVLDDSKGVLKLAWIEDTDGDFTLKSITGQLKKGKSGLYFNLLDMSGDDLESEGFYYFGKVKKEEGRIYFWFPSSGAFHKAYEAKKIQAIIEKTKSEVIEDQRVNQIKLLDDPSVIVGLIESDTANFFNTDDPVILKKSQ